MSRATRPCRRLPVGAREQLLARLLYYRSLRRVSRVMGLSVPTLRRAVVGRSLRPGQAREVLEALRAQAHYRRDHWGQGRWTARAA